jgi:hypothetical protein
VNGSLLWTHEFRLSDQTTHADVSATADSVYLVAGNYTSGTQYTRKYDSAGNVLWTLPLGSDRPFISATAAGLFVGSQHSPANFNLYNPPFISHYDPGGNLMAGVSLSAFLSNFYLRLPLEARTNRVYLIGDTAGRGCLVSLLSEPKSSRPVSWIKPRSTIEPSLNLLIQWSGSKSGGPDIQDYTIYVSDDGGPFTPWLTQTTATEATFTGVRGHTYGFYSIARNLAGTYESAKSAAEIPIWLPIPPVSRVDSVGRYPSLPPNALAVSWSGTPTSAPIEGYDIYVSVDGDSGFSKMFPVCRFGGNACSTGTFFGDFGHTYGFYSIARDIYGTEEDPKTVAEATGTIGEGPKPTSTVAGDLPGTASSPNFLVRWYGIDPPHYNEVMDYTIYVSDNGGPFTAWLTHFEGSSAWFSGLLGHTYRFFSIARNFWGLEENMKSWPEATTQVPAVMPADVNSDRRIDCSDVAVVKTSLGKKTGQLGFDARADVNKDGIVDIRDLAAVTQKLAPTTKCP